MPDDELADDVLADDVLAAVHQRSAALVSRSWDVVDRLLHPDFVYTNSRGERLPRAAYLAFLRDGPLAWRDQWLEAPLVAAAGATAVVTGVVVDDVEMAGEDHVLRFATTQTYVHVDGQWLYLAGQTAPLEVS